MRERRQAITIDMDKALPKAWDIQWKAAIKRAANTTHGRFSSPYVVATDLENQIRQFASEQADGKAWGSTGAAWGRAYYSGRINMIVEGRPHWPRPYSLLDVCRAYLQTLEQLGKLEGHNFGRHHISGARYRPAGYGMGETEKRTIAKRTAVKPIHFHIELSSIERKRKDTPLLCMQDRAPAKRRGMPVFRSRRRGSRTTQVASEITCARCKALATPALCVSAKMIRRDVSH